MVNLEMVTVAFEGVNLEIGHHSSHETFDSTLRKDMSCEREVLFSKEYKIEYSLCLLKYYYVFSVQLLLRYFGLTLITALKTTPHHINLFSPKKYKEKTVCPINNV